MTSRMGLEKPHAPPLGVHGDIFRKTPFHFKVVVLRIVDLINHCFVLVRLTMYTAVDK